MLNVKRILAPDDGSPCAERACEQAAFLADALGAHLDIVEVVPEDQQPGSSWLQDVKISEADVCEDLHLLIDQRSDANDEDSPHVVRRTAYHDKPAMGILQYAEEQASDLIVMGTHGRDQIDQMVLGSVAERVVRHADCPVLTVNQYVEAAPGDHVQTILCPVDFSTFSTETARCAGAVAATYDAHLHLLHIEGEESPVGIAPEDSAAKASGGDAEETLEALAADLDYANTTTHVVPGDPGSTIVDFAEDPGADLIILSTHGRTGLKRVLLGSVAETVVRTAPCPVLTLRAFGKSILSDTDTTTEAAETDPSEP